MLAGEMPVLADSSLKFHTRAIKATNWTMQKTLTVQVAEPYGVVTLLYVQEVPLELSPIPAYVPSALPMEAPTSAPT